MFCNTISGVDISIKLINPDNKLKKDNHLLLYTTKRMQKELYYILQAHPHDCVLIIDADDTIEDFKKFELVHDICVLCDVRILYYYNYKLV